MKNLEVITLKKSNYPGRHSGASRNPGLDTGLRRYDEGGTWVVTKKRLWVSLFSLLPVSLAAQEAGGSQAPGGFSGFIVTMFPILVFGAIFYFLLLRPQQKAGKERSAMISGIKRMDRVLTSGGFYGTVVGLRGDTLDLKLSDNVKVEMSRQYVVKVVASTNGASSPAANPDK